MPLSWGGMALRRFGLTCVGLARSVASNMWCVPVGGLGAWLSMLPATVEMPMRLSWTCSTALRSRTRGAGPFRAPKLELSLAGLLGARPPCKGGSRRDLPRGASTASMRDTGTTSHGPVRSGRCPRFPGRTCVLSLGSGGACGVLLALAGCVPC